MLDRLLKNSVMEGYEKFTGRSMEFLSKPWNGKSGNPEGTTSIIIDHFFQVKSVGTVALGFVLSGTAKNCVQIVQHLKVIVIESNGNGQNPPEMFRFQLLKPQLD